MNILTMRAAYNYWKTFFFTAKNCCHNNFEIFVNIIETFSKYK